MQAPSTADAGGNALLLAVFVLLLLLGVWNVWLNRRLRQARSLEEELRGLVGRRLGERIDLHDPAFADALEEGLRTHLPEVIKREVEAPSSALHGALTERLARQMQRPDDEALDAAVHDALVYRVTTILAGPGPFAELFKEVDEKLGEHFVARCRDASPAMVEAIDAGLRSRVENIFAAPDDFAELFEEIDARLGERITAQAEAGGAGGAGRDAVIAERLVARLQRMFATPDEHDDLFEVIDERLGERILGTLSRMPDDAAARMDAIIREALVAELQYIFDNPDSYQALVETIDEQLGQRITRLLGQPTPETQEALEGAIRAGLTRRLQEVFAHPDRHQDLIEGIDEGLGKRINRRLREEGARGGDGLLDQLLVEELRQRVRRRLDGRTESLDLANDAGIAKHDLEGSS